jgi:hypothetical protein
MFVNLAMEMEGQNIAQRCAIFFYVTLPPQHMEKFTVGL